MAQVLLEDHSSSTDDIKRCMHSLRFTAGTVRIKTFLLPSGWQGRWGRREKCTRGKCECAERGKQQGARSKGGNSPHSSCCCMAVPPEVLLLFALGRSEQLMGQRSASESKNLQPEGYVSTLAADEWQRELDGWDASFPHQYILVTLTKGWANPQKNF